VNRPSLVLLHGVGLDHTVWQPVLAELGPTFEVSTPDLLGHGARPPAPVGTTLGTIADDVAATIAPGSHIVGFSLGALVAQHLALHRPELVASLTLVSSVCRRTPEEREAVLARLHVAEADLAGSTAASIQRWYADTGVADDLVRRTEATLLANDPGSFAACYRVFATADAEVADDLHRIVVPTMAVTGELDPGSTPAMAHRLADAMPHCRAVVMPDTRHMLPVQRPRELVAALTAFIGEDAHA